MKMNYIKNCSKYLLLLLFATPTYASLISHNDYTPGSVITAGAQNSNENTIVNLVNGGLDSTNIAAGGVQNSNIQTNTITEDRFATVVQSSFNFVYSTMTLDQNGSPNSIPYRVTNLETDMLSRGTWFRSATAGTAAQGSVISSFTFTVSSATYLGPTNSVLILCSFTAENTSGTNTNTTIFVTVDGNTLTGNYAHMTPNTNTYGSMSINIIASGLQAGSHYVQLNALAGGSFSDITNVVYSLTVVQINH